jgi:L-seryl-tRNA(Ser) seleniumtransferase
VDGLLRHPSLVALRGELPRTLVVEAVRATIADARRAASAGSAAPGLEALAALVAGRARSASTPGLRRVINATGIVLHTNLGRAPLAPSARRAVAQVAAGYSSLEYDLEHGRRGDRGAGVERWLCRLTGAPGALAVNNGAAALLLALSALAAGRKVVVSRGELVEIGGSFRVPEILEKSGATLIEVGSTNRTHLRDYEKAFERHPDLALLLRVHRSNFRIDGFTAIPAASDLAKLARRRRVPFVEDLGSGALVDLRTLGLAHEPTVAQSLASGCDLVTFSGDKLLGGSQAGLIVGRRSWVDRLRKDPLARALRCDKLALAALEASLALYADPVRAASEIPALALLRARPEVLEARARALAAALSSRISGVETRVVKARGEVGGGALPLTPLEDWVVEVRHDRWPAQELDARARAGEPPVIGTIKSGAYRVDPRALLEGEDEEAIESLARAWS